MSNARTASRYVIETREGLNPFPPSRRASVRSSATVHVDCRRDCCFNYSVNSASALDDAHSIARSIARLSRMQKSTPICKDLYDSFTECARYYARLSIAFLEINAPSRPSPRCRAHCSNSKGARARAAPLKIYQCARPTHIETIFHSSAASRPHRPSRAHFLHVDVVDVRSLNARA